MVVFFCCYYVYVPMNLFKFLFLASLWSSGKSTKNAEHVPAFEQWLEGAVWWGLKALGSLESPYLIPNASPSCRARNLSNGD